MTVLVATGALVAALGLVMLPGGAPVRPRASRWSGRAAGASAGGRRPAGAREAPVTRRSRLLAAGSLGLAAQLALGGLVGTVVAVAAASGVAWWLGRQEPPGVRRRRERLASDLPHVVDLLAALLRAGQAPGSAAALVAGTAEGPAAEVLAGVARRSAAGLDPYAVWRPVAEQPGTELLGAAMLRSLDSGSRVVDVVDRVAEELRRDLRAAASAHARTVGVRATVPLAACFLPALVLIGVVPFVASLVGPLLDRL